MEYYYNTIKLFDAIAFSFQNDVLSSNLNPIIGKENLLLKQAEFLQFLRNTVTVCSFFGVDTFDEKINSLNDDINELDNSLRMGNKVGIKKALMVIRVCFSGSERFSPQKELVKKIELLNEDEKTRLNEAFNCYVNDLYYSSIVMSVSSIESRLFSLMKSKNTEARIDRMTLGELISEYLKNEANYNNIIPKKHLPLLNYCNTYRVLSAHPKKEKITKSNATSIICMTCSFLFDDNCRVIEEIF